MDDLSDGASSRQRRKSNSLSGGYNAVSGSTESKRRDSIKSGLDELQRALPQFGTPEEEKVAIIKIKKYFCAQLDISFSDKPSDDSQRGRQVLEVFEAGTRRQYCKFRAHFSGD